MIARVRDVTAASISAGSRLRSSPTSTKTGRAPTSAMAAADPTNEFGAVMTSSPAPMPSTRSAWISAEVPLSMPIAKRAPHRAANAASNRSTSAPRMNWPLSSTRSMTARTSRFIESPASPSLTNGTSKLMGVIRRVVAPAARRAR